MVSDELTNRYNAFQESKYSLIREKAIQERNEAMGTQLPITPFTPNQTLDPEFNKILQKRIDISHEWITVPPVTNFTEPEPEVPYSHPPNRPFREWLIVTNGTRLQDQTSMALDAIADINDPPYIFHRSLELVKITNDENNIPIIKPIGESSLRGILERCASFVERNGKGEHKPVPPPLHVVKDVSSLHEWNTIFPLAGIVECPIIMPTGDIITKKGYDAETRLYYAPINGFVLPDIPKEPTPENIRQSKELLQEVFVDFPFVDKASRTNTIGTLLGAVLRPMISGCVPLALLDKPQAGTGASLIADVIGHIVTGRSTPMLASPEDDAAWRKLITATLVQGRIVSIIDNVESKLYTASLAVILTGTVWEDRVLGRSEMITLPNRTVWIATGNNIQLGGDLPRRCFWVRMDALSAKPWQQRKTPFKHSNLLEWVDTNRGAILRAIMILTRSWIRAGKPKPSDNIPKMGGFESWRDVVGGILEHAEFADFLGNLEKMYLESDTETPAWESFFSKWVDIFGLNTEVTVSTIEERLHKEQDSYNVGQEGKLSDTLPENIADAWAGRKNFNRVIGKSLSKMNQRIFTNNLKLEKGTTEHHAVKWKVVFVSR